MSSRGSRSLFCLSRAGVPPNASAVEWLAADLTEANRYEPALTRCSTVIHLAAATGRRAAAVYHRDNYEATKTLLDACVRCGVSNFLFMSTIAVHAADQSLYPYADSKRRAEELIAASPLNYTILRPCMVFGPGAPVLEALAKIAGAPVTPLPDGGRAQVQPVCVADLAAFVAHVLDRNWFSRSTVELGGRDVVDMRSLLCRIRHQLGKPKAPALSVPRPAALLAARMAELCFPSNPPLSRGQMTAFMADGTAAHHDFVDAWGAKLKGIDEMLDLSLDANRH